MRRISFLVKWVISFAILTPLLFAQTVVLNEIVSSNSNSLIDAYGESPDWIELYNPSDESINLTGFGLSDNLDDPGKWIFPQTIIESHSYLLIFASGTSSDSIHTNFRISAGGEDLVLIDLSGSIVDQAYIPALPQDVSYGRLPSEEFEWAYYLNSTPGGINDTQAFDTPTPLIVEFSQQGGLYWGGVNLTLQSYFDEDTIYYSLDGSSPTQNSAIAISTIEINESTVVRARLMHEGVLSEKTFSHTFIIDKDTDLPVIAIAAEPVDLWDNSTGIYVNYESDREIPIHIEFFEAGGLRGFSQDAGMKMFGGWSRHFPQKSFSIFARSVYGPAEFDYRIFPDQPFEAYEAFVLRNSGGDFDVTHVRDAVMQTLVRDIDVDRQAYRPTVIYLNGEYWGILNSREKLNEHYIEAHHGVLESDLDMLENNWSTIHGDRDHFNSYLDYIETHDMTSPESYDYVKGQIDLDEYLNYMTSEIYFANVDWPGWNLKYWRPRTEDGKWRWILYDLDDGFGLGRPEHYGSPNMIHFTTTTEGDGWPNPPWSTFVFRNLLENEQFKIDFINRYVDHFNSIWQSDLVISTIDNLQNEIAEEMIMHLDRWSLSQEDWLWEMNRLRTFANERPPEALQVIASELDAGELHELELAIEPAGAGKIRLNNNLDVWSPQWQGQYFENIPITALAEPNPGYQFIGWILEDDTLSEPVLDLSFSDDISLVALFEAMGGFTSSVVINEINYHSSPEFEAGDWIELYNRSEEDIDISEWILMDESDDHQFELPGGTIITAEGYVVICQDRDLLLLRFPDADPLQASFSFGLSNGGETIRLFNDNNQIIDSLTYDDIPPWPASPDGQGPSLGLNNAFSDNSQAQNWSASWDHGSPGLANEIITSNDLGNTVSAPDHFELLQNYPNPFNSTTIIRYRLPESSFVKVTIYNILGEEVRILIARQQDIGSYRVQWDGKDKHNNSLSSGIYIFNLSAEGSSITKRMLLLK